LYPKSKGEIVYDNRGSSQRLIHYLQHEARENKRIKGHEITFFNQNLEDYSANEVQQKIDKNVKGLHAKDSHFHSIVISPSQQELQHFGNDTAKLQAYTRQVMENYAANFNLKNDIKLSSNDLVWFATIHETRRFSGTDTEVKEGKAKSGELKQGLQTHIHVIISARDKEMKITLSPNGHKNRFSREEWTKKNIQDFNQNFQYKPKYEHYEQKSKENKRERNYQSSDEKKLQYLVGKLDDMMKRHSLWEEDFDWRKVANIGKEQRFSKDFYKKLNSLDERLKFDQTIPTDYLKDLGYKEDKKQEFGHQQDLQGKQEKPEKERSISITFEKTERLFFSLGSEQDSSIEPQNFSRKFKKKKPQIQLSQKM
jgi:hypothetical protein